MNDLQQPFSRPLPSKASRKPPARSKASSRGHVTSRTKRDPASRLRYFESKREQEVLFLLLARPDVVDIWDQPTPIEFLDADGRVRTHTFDFLATLVDGRRIAIAVKPSSIVRRSGFREALLRIKAATPLSFADEVILITEQSYRPSEARNAQKLHDFRRTQDPEADRAISAVIRELEGSTTMAEVARRSGLGGRGFRAAFRAIYTGALNALDTGDILPSTSVCVGVVQ